MGPLERLCLRWNEYESDFKQGLLDLRQNEELFDVMLISASKSIKAHKVILSVCSPKFRSIIGSAPVETRGSTSIIWNYSFPQDFQIKGLSNYFAPRNRYESQPSTSFNFSTDITPYPPHDSQELYIVSHNLKDKSFPDMEKEECNILDESNTLELTQKAYEQVKADKNALECISLEQN
ncbi:unnamed protein product [Lepeophtheirus salmonis]|uniref:(salmon louse) hypothetical protein n=1 Tax=Lepeophtheirus salmonis TaxID=72036 RepID=A0A7R8D8K3_LEPSM|nr:unnamed protein product [Lepeophtheirus salmonis]CAF3009407.1 unnamed protein product [Lepeophtheirus salmonis]